MKSSEHRVFFLGEDDFVSSRNAEINEVDSFHIRKVLRLKKEDKIIVVTLEGKFTATILNDDAPRIQIMLEECIESPPATTKKISLLQAIPKLRKMDEIIEKSTEFGVYAIFPVFSLRSPLGPGSPLIKGKEERWKRVAMAASKQSRRSQLPLIHPPTSLSSLIQDPNLLTDTLKIVFWEQEQDSKLLSLVPLVQAHQNIAICIGPEGGFTLSEVDEFVQRGFITCSLGRQILRTETAGPFAVGFIESVS